jgi:hypothetical protein
MTNRITISALTGAASGLPATAARRCSHNKERLLKPSFENINGSVCVPA